MRPDDIRGQVNFVTKSGTNRLRGLAFEFLRDDRFDASPFFGTLDCDGDGKKDATPLKYRNFGRLRSLGVFDSSLKAPGGDRDEG